MATPASTRRATSGARLLRAQPWLARPCPCEARRPGKGDGRDERKDRRECDSHAASGKLLWHRSSDFRHRSPIAPPSVPTTAVLESMIFVAL